MIRSGFLHRRVQKQSLLHAGIQKHDGRWDSRGRQEEETSSQSSCDCRAPLQLPPIPPHHAPGWRTNRICMRTHAQTHTNTHTPPIRFHTCHVNRVPRGRRHKNLTWLPRRCFGFRDLTSRWTMHKLLL